MPSSPGSSEADPESGGATALGTRDDDRPAHITPQGPWPTVRPPSARAVLLGRVAAAVAVAWFVTVYSVATDILARADHLLAGVIVGVVLGLTGAIALWIFASRTPSRVEPARGPGMGLARDRAAARTVLRSGGTPDAEQRRLIAVDVQADAKLPLVAGATFAFLGPLVVAVANDSGPLAWVGPVTAGLIVLLLAAVGWRTWSAHALHRAADRKHTVPRFVESGSPWRPWPRA